ncbi:sodium:proton antiporter [Mucilaginibacter xinganensis]|uniref:Sodium:proton antiporter n=1 Tax=Mucilaginibacter xinganensis TaxID=1234841 RepID=A0A223NT08_9SPHI|nr:sodium:proton antiporter [Mucilaginibacter xinganensis]
MTVYYIISILIFLTAVFAYINDRLIKWPPTIGIMVIALFSSILLAILGNLIPVISSRALLLVSNINFEQVLMKIMLSFLLFAGALHVDAGELKKEKWPVMLMATAGTFISTFLVSIMAYYLFLFLHLNISYIYCLLFGALISPTDPIAVMGILKQAGIPKSLEIKITGESLFNDGVGVVVFLTILEVAINGTDKFSVGNTALLFLKEAGGGLLFGAVLGYTAHLLIKSIDNYRVEVLITLAVVMCGYSLADHFHLSGPLAIIVAGIIMGTKGKKEGLSEISRDYLGKFWDLTDEIFNAILFLLIGLEMLVIKINPTIMIVGGIMIVVVLLARWACVALPVLFLKNWIRFEKNAVIMLTWGGLRGGLSVAMALSIPEAMHRDEFVLITYIIVVFSIIVQGLTIGKLAQKTA